MNMANFSFLTIAQALGVCSIRIFENVKNMGDPYYEPIIIVHD